MSPDETEQSALNNAPLPEFPDEIIKLVGDGVNIRDAMLMAAQHGNQLAIQSSVFLFVNDFLRDKNVPPTKEDICLWAEQVDVTIDEADWERIDEVIVTIPTTRKRLAWLGGPLPGPKE